MRSKKDTRYWGNASRPKTKTEFFNAVTTPSPSGDGKVATIRIYGPIDSWGGWWGVSAKDVAAVLDALPDSVEQIIVRLNSPGGEAFEGIAITNLLRAHKASVTGVVDGLAASAASVIAAGCDETVMSPGTQMMIHSPSVISWGQAKDLRKDADILDGLQDSIIEIYQGKAGDNDWTQLVEDETWLTAEDAVTLGLADRVGVVPDAGETSTAGDEEIELVIIDPDEAEDSAVIVPLSEWATPLRQWAASARTQAPTPKPPSSTEPVEPNRKDATMATKNTLADGLRERLGLTDADASDDAIFAAVDEVLEQATAPAPTTEVPEGTLLVDQAAFDALQADANAGREAREQQNTERRARVVDQAMQDGRIAAASRDAWLAQLEANEESATALINSLPKNTAVPVAEIGHSDDTENAEGSAYSALYGDEKKGA